MITDVFGAQGITISTDCAQGLTTSMTTDVFGAKGITTSTIMDVALKV